MKRVTDIVESCVNGLEAVSDAFDAALAVLDRLAQWLAIALVGVIAVAMILQVFFRYVVNSSLSWSEELSVWSLVWLVFIGSVVLIRDWEHINIPTFVNWLPLRLRPYVIIVAKCLSIAFLATMTYLGFEMILFGFHADAPVLHLSTRWAKLSIPVGGALMCLFALSVLLKDLVRLWRRDYRHFADQGNPGLE